MQFFSGGTASGKGSANAEKKFHLHFLVVWIGSRSTFVLCTALLAAEYTEGDRAQSEGQQCPQAL